MDRREAMEWDRVTGTHSREPATSRMVRWMAPVGLDGDDRSHELTEEMPAVHVTPLQEVELGGNRVIIALQTGREQSLALTWNDRSLSPSPGCPENTDPGCA